jgi:hypothetical protein
MSKITMGLRPQGPIVGFMAWNMISDMPVGAKSIEEAGYVFRKESVSGVQQGNKIRLQ